MRRSFADHGFAKTARLTSAGTDDVTEDGQDYGGRFLLGVGGQIFEIQHDYHVARSTVLYAAVGSGAPVALGAFHALDSVPGLSLQARAAKALEASEAYCVAVRGPFHFVELPPCRRSQ